MKKIRLDVYLTENGLAPSREKAKAYIMAGTVFVNNQKSDKAGALVSEEDIVEVRGKKMPYVSRGGLKLEKAVNSFGLDLSDKICMDAGASTGGFTDCMLQNGAAKVYSVDVGYGQLAWELRTNEKVVNLERTNIRYLTEEQVPEKVGFISADLSFISLKLVLPVLKNFLAESGQMVCLIKPQFEAGREKVGKKGVVRDKSVHEEVIESIYDFASSIGLYAHGLDFSPVRGPEGNIEYLILLSAQDDNIVSADIIPALVKASHEKLDK